MLERYTEEVRRTIFYAGFEAAHLGSRYVEAEHLLLGLVRDNPENVNQFALSKVSEISIRNQIVAFARTREVVSINIEIRLSNEGKEVLSVAAKEADALGHQHIGTGHLLLGLLIMHDSLAAHILRESGAGIERVRRELASATQQVTAESRNNSLSEQIARKAREKAREILESGPAAERLRKKIEGDGWTDFPNFEDVTGLTCLPKNYSAKSRRSIFFAQYDAWQFGSPVVETEHLLLGVLREDKAHLGLFFSSADSIATIRAQIEKIRTNPLEKLSIPAALLLSVDCKHVQINAEQEAALLGSKQVGPEHLLLGLLREEGSFAAQLLREHGAEIERIRSGLTVSPKQSPSNPVDPSQPSEPAA